VSRSHASHAPAARWLLAAAVVALVPCTSVLRADTQPTTASTTLHASPEEVHEALLGTLAEWKMRKASLADRIVKTSWRRAERGREAFRDRLVAEYRQEGYVTHLTVRHERQRRMHELKQTLTSPSAPWQDWSGDPQLVRAVVRHVEQALGQEPPPLDMADVTGRSRAPAPVRAQREYVVSPGAAVRVNELKVKRRDVIEEIRALDAEILDAVYDGRYEEIAGEVERLKSRKAALERQVAAIDKDILALVLAD